MLIYAITMAQQATHESLLSLEVYDLQRWYLSCMRAAQG